MKIESTPAADYYHMPGEFEPHDGCILIWPERPGSFGRDLLPARRAFRDVIAAIAESERVYVAAGEAGMPSAAEMLFCGRVRGGEREGSLAFDGGDEDGERGDRPLMTHCGGEGIASADGAWRANVELFCAETDDAWARDIAPTFLAPDHGGQFRARGASRAGAAPPIAAARDGAPYNRANPWQDGTSPIAARDGALCAASRGIRAVNWSFNAWGGDIDGLYSSWDKDDAFAVTFARRFGFPYYDASPFVAEGGSFHSDGEGTLLVTESCLLSAGRNPGLSKGEIEERLREYLGARKVLWLPRGIEGDETNEHVDNACAFLSPGEVVLAWTDDPLDPQHAICRQCLDYLRGERDAMGRRLIVRLLPLPDHPVTVTGKEAGGYDYEEGEAVRESGERLAASYVNFYISNGAIVMPAFGGENEESDRRAAGLMRQWARGRRVVQVQSRAILLGGGNIHCITQQIPRG